MPIVTDSIPHRLDQRLRQIYIQEHERFNLEERARKLGEALKKNKGETTRQYS